MDNAYQWVTVYEVLADTLDINHFDPSRFTGNPTLGVGTLLIAGANMVWRLTDGFYKCITKMEPPLSWRI
jgi:hypothetical protein